MVKPMPRAFSLALALVTAGAAAMAEPLKVGEHRPVRIETSHPYVQGDAAGAVVWRHRLSHPGATYLSVHFAAFDLADGDVLAITNPWTGVRREFRGRGVMDAGAFWATHVDGDDVILELSSAGGAPGFGVVIDEYVHGTVSLGWPVPGDAPDAICGTDDKDNAICYATSHAAEYAASRAVARLLINGSSLCTGSLISCQNHFITNEHCITNQSQATNTDYEFMSEAPTCATNNCQLCFPGTVITGATYITDSASLDYAFLQITTGDPQATYGYLEIDNRAAIIDEQIFIPQHPGGRAKELAIFSTHASDASGRCEVFSTNASPCSGGPGDIGYYCDTEGGSSGSPVLAVSDMKMIGLHHCANCPNRGVPITAIMAQIGGQIPSCGCTLAISPPTLPGGVVGSAYSQTLTASGGTAPYTWSLASGALPAGLSLSSAGVISGTPTAASVASFTVRAQDGTGCSGTRAYSLAICGTIVLAPATLPGGTQGQAYSQTITASGGTSPYTFAVTAGAPPTGLTLSSAGVLSGTPTATGTFSFTVTATDAGACTGSQAYQVAISSPGCGMTLAPATLPDAEVGTSYAQTFTASGGTAPYTYAVTAGALPAGLTLALGGSLSGTPTVPGPASFTVTARDAGACAVSQAYAIDVFPRVDFVVGEALVGSNTNRVRIFDGSGGATAADFQAYGAGRFGTNVAGADVNGGASDEVLTAPGPGDVYGPHVRGFDRTGTALAKVNFYAYGTLKFGANVAAGDTDGDGFGEIVSGAGPGEVFGPHVRGWNVDGASATAIAGINFFAYGTLKYGVKTASGALDADGPGELLTGPGPGAIFGPQVRGWNVDGGPTSAMAKVNFNAFALAGYGVNVAAGDVDADGFGEILCAPGPGPSHPARILGYDYDGTTVVAMAGVDVTPFTSRYGARLGAGDVAADGFSEVAVSPGPDPAAATTVTAYSFATGSGTQVVSFNAFPAPSCCGANPSTGELGY